MNKSLLLLFFTSLGFSQVGVNTTTPNASSMLDVVATNKGVLFPRVSLSNTNLTTLDGVNTAATGLLIWNTNATTIGGNGVGYYYFNGTIWIPVVQTGANDHDWYEVGTTVAPNAITDNMFHTGNVVIGKSTITPDNPKLSIEENGAGTGLFAPKILYLRDSSTSATQHFGISLEMRAITTAPEYGISIWHNNPNAPLKYGVISEVENGSGTNSAFQGRATGTGINSGIENQIFDSGSPSSSRQTGLGNEFQQPTTGWTYGVQNSFSTNNLAIDSGRKFGMYNIFGANVGGDLYGTYNDFSIVSSSTSNRYGNFTTISPLSGGTHYGIYADVTKSNSYAGYFLGRMSIGTTTLNNYILPASRGLVNQTMQTDGAGNVTWVNHPIDTDDQATDVFSLTGNTLNLSLQNDGVVTQTVDLSSLAGDDDWTDVGTDIERQAGNVYIGDTSATNNNLYISNQIIDWDNIAYTIDPNGDSIMNEIQFDDGSVADPSIRFSDINTGFFSPITATTSYSANSVESFRIHPSGDIAIGQTIDPDFKLSTSSLFGNSNVRIGNNDLNDNVVEVDHSGQLGNGLEVNMNSIYTLASRSAISANSTGMVINVDLSRYETGSPSNLFGVKSIITDDITGVEYGVYSEALQANGFAGYFLGRMSIGTTTANNYILPTSRGTNGQIMVTNGTGDVSWVNSGTVFTDTDNQQIDVLSLTGDTLNISLQDDAVATQTLNLGAIDNQATDVFSLTGNTLNLSLQNDGVATQTLDLSPIANTHWTDVTTHIQPTIASKSVVIGDAIVAPTAKLSIKRDSAPATPQLEIVENQANDDGKIKFSNAVEILNEWSLFARADDTPASNLFNINHTIGGNIVRINGEGRVGIMRTAATNALEVGGDASKTTAGAWLANSDSRLKKNISTISPTDALNKVLSLRGVNYEWNDDKTGMKRPEGNQIGFVAQEIQEVFPEKVSEDKLGYLQTAYGDYDPIIFQAIKALSEKIDKLEKENEELKKLIKGKE